MLTILTGAPGCGKTTVGTLLAQKLDRTLVDVDPMIVTLAGGKTIPEIFAQNGEEIFRQLETSALENLGKQSGLVVSTGGGCVTRQQNYPLLHQNGVIVWLERDLALLPTDGRPLSQTTRLADMYAVRRPMYEAFSDIRVENSGSPEDTVNKILSKLEDFP